MILFVAEHASADVPHGIDLGVGADVMRQHVAVDIGVAPLTTELARRFGAEAVLAPWSRLVVDCNRAPDDPSAIPQVSDGFASLLPKPEPSAWRCTTASTPASPTRSPATRRASSSRSTASRRR
jgi:hypothetical protein